MAVKNELTAYCGLYCGDCIRYQSRASDLASQILGELKKIEFCKYAEIKCSSDKQLDPVRQFVHYSECCKVLEAIVALRCNSACRVGGGCSAFSCGILECCQKKRLKGCWQCVEFEGCKKLDALKSVHGDSVRQNLRTIKKFGLNKWTDHRYMPYVWQY